MKRHQRKPEAVTVPAHLAEPFVEHFVEPHEVSSLSEAQELAADRHSEQWDTWYADQSQASAEVPVVWDRADLGTDRIDDVVEVQGAPLVGLSVEQGRRLLLGEPFPFRDQLGFERAMMRGAP